MSNFKGDTISDFLNLVSSNKPTPGGGSASCIVGATAAALLEMYLNLSIGKEKYKQEEEKLITCQNTLLGLKEKLLDQADLDATSFDQVMAAYRSKNVVEIQKALVEATQVPLVTAEMCGEIIRLANSVRGLGNINAQSDFNSAIHLAKGALLSALENVKINLKEIDNKNFVNETESKVYSLRKLC